MNGFSTGDKARRAQPQDADGTEDLRQVAAYLRGVADAAAALKSEQMLELADMASSPDGLMGPASRRPSLFDAHDYQGGARWVDLDAGSTDACVASPFSTIPQRWTLPYGTKTISLGPAAPPARAPQASLTPVWHTRGGARLVDLVPPSRRFEACAGPVRRSTLSFSIVPQPGAQPISIQPEICLSFEDERQSSIRLRIPELPSEWYQLTGTDDR